MKPSRPFFVRTKSPTAAGGFVQAWLLPVVCLLAVAGLALAVWQSSQRLDTVARETARQLDAERRSAAQALEQAQAAQAETRALRERIAVLEAGQADMRGQQSSLEALYQQLVRGQDDWVLAEVEQTLQIAAQQLALAGNRSSAIAALQFVEQRLGDTTRADLIALREAVRIDLEALSAARGLDLGGMILQLDQVIARIDSLPLLSEPASEQTVRAAGVTAYAGPVWQRLWLDLQAEFRKLIEIRRIEDTRVLLLPPDQAVVLRENLKLRLLNARLALMSRQSAAWHDDLDAAAQSLETYFDSADPAVRLQLSRVRALRATDLSEALPSLSSVVIARTARTRDLNFQVQRSQPMSPFGLAESVEPTTPQQSADASAGAAAVGSAETSAQVSSETPDATVVPVNPSLTSQP